jgi:carbamoyltransferase
MRPPDEPAPDHGSPDRFARAGRGVIICGIKLTHDAGVALVDGGRLVFSVEVEKLANNPRHHELDDFELVGAVLADFGYELRDVDRFVLDGWGSTPPLRRTWGGYRITLDLAPYRRGIVSADLMRPYRFQTLDLRYTSYSHYAGHVAGAYCTSPFARAGESAYVLCWDGAMFPFLYRYDGDAATVVDLGPLFLMLGDTYHELAQLYEPFDAPIKWPHTLALPGKIMAYIAFGEPDERAIDMLQVGYVEAKDAVFGTKDPGAQLKGEQAGRRILEHMRSRLSVPGVSADDMIASIHAFLARTLVSSLSAAIEADGARTPNLCLVGGCALNIKWNRAIRSAGCAEHVWIPPFPNDAGSALGTACCELLGLGGARHLEWHHYAGPELLDTASVAEGWTARSLSIAGLARLLHESGAPVVYLDGRAELGPRSLGHRSILAPAVSAAMKSTINTVKGREPYRPVAPMCLEHRAPEVFSPGTPDPYMLFDHDVRADWLDRVPAICHLDATARLQTVSHEDEPRLFELLSEYEALSGIPLLCNTSANHRGSGFFPDVASAMRWGRVRAVWSAGVLYERTR